jgi:hypothetical protein
VKLSGSDGTINLDLEVEALEQLPGPDDTCPLPERDPAGDTIAGYVDEIRITRPVNLTVPFAPNSIAPKVLALISDAIRPHFASGLNDIAVSDSQSRRARSVTESPCSTGSSRSSSSFS